MQELYHAQNDNAPIESNRPLKRLIGLGSLILFLQKRAICFQGAKK